MKTIADPPKRDRWARLRFSIIGPLMAAPAEPGQLNGAFIVLAAKTWRHPVSGLDVRFGASTLERWYYTARRAADPVAALKDRLRGDAGCFPSLSAEAIAALTRQYREHPGWTAQLQLDNLRVACKASDSSVASYATVRRYLLAQGMHRQARPKRATEGAAVARVSSGAAGGPQLRGRARRGAVAPRLPSRLAQGAHPRRRLGQARCCWASSMTARAWCVTGSGISTRRRTAWCTACRRRS